MDFRRIQWTLAAGMVAAAVVLRPRGVAAPPPTVATRPPEREEAALAALTGSATNAGDLERAAEPGRGRNARSPLQIPWRGWRDILIRTWGQIGNDRVMAVAGGVTFYALLAIFPAITAFISIYGLFATRAGVRDQLAPLFGLFPVDTVSFVIEEVGRIAATSNGALSVASALGLAIALWSANSGTKAIFDALNVAYGETEKRSFLRLNLISLAFTVGTLLLILVAAAAVVVVPLVLGRFLDQDFEAWLFSLLRWPALFAVLVAALSVLYRYGPSRRDAKWRWVTPGSIAATLVWLAASGLFSWYLANFGNYEGTYGSLGAAIGFMTWLWITAIVVLAGAELDAEIEHQTARDSTVGAEKPLGARGATMADTVGAAQD